MPLIPDRTADEIRRRMTSCSTDEVPSVEALALEYGVSLNTVRAIRDGQPWIMHAIRERKYRPPREEFNDPDQLDFFLSEELK